MAAAFGWGVLAASSLLLGAAIALLVRVPLRVVGWVMAFGAGVLISAVAFDLVEKAAGSVGTGLVLVAGMFAGCAVFFIGNALIARSGGGRRKSARGGDEDDSPLSIVLGTVLDGVPESAVIGLTLYSGGEVGVAYLAAVFVSNLPEALASTAGLRASGWRTARILAMWATVAVVSGAASAAGFGLFGSAPAEVEAFVLTFAAGAILTMLADTMMPEAFEHGGRLAGVLTTIGFVVAFGLHELG